MQETWLRLARSDASGIDDLAGRLATVTSRVCVDIVVEIDILADPARLARIDPTR